MRWFGDNGIISNAQNASVESKVALLQDYLDQFYIENYKEFEPYSTKIAGLKANKMSSNWIYQGKLGYVLDSNGNLHYYLNYDNLPNEMKEIIGGYSSKTYADYIEGNDVYGITEDLKVYYQVKNSDNVYKYYGEKNPQFSKENGNQEIFDSESGISKVIGGNTIADARKVTSLSFNEASGITNLNDFYNFIDLDKLILNDLSDFKSLEGIEYCTKLRAIFIQNCKIDDYSALAKLPNLKYIYFYWANNDEIEKFCSPIVGIGGKDMPMLIGLGIYGAQHFVFDDYGFNYHRDYYNEYSGSKSGFSRIELLSNLSEKTKKQITRLYLNNNSITNVENLYEFQNVGVLRIEYNNITSLKGIYNKNKDTGMKKIACILANNNLLGKDLEDVSLDNQNDVLSDFSVATLNGENYEFTRNLTNIWKLNLSYNTELRWIDYLKPLTTITELWLTGCTNLSNSSILTISNIINQSGNHIEADYQYYLSLMDPSIRKVNFSKRTINITDFKNILSAKTNLLSLDMSDMVITADDGGNLDNYNKEINDFLKGLTTLQYLSLKGLSNITTVDFIEGTTKLRQLDLRGTGATDLSKLDIYMTNCATLFIDNTGIDVTKIQHLFNRVKNNGVDANLYVTSTCRGIQMCNTTLTNQIANCTEITDCYWEGAYLPNWCVLDFRKCVNLKGYEYMYFLSCNVKLYLPTTLKGIGDSYGAFQCGWEILNAEELVNLEYFSIPWNSWGYFAETCNRIPNLKIIDFYGDTNSVDFSTLTNPEKYEDIRVYGYDGNAEANNISASSLNALENFNNLKSLSIYHCKGLKTLPNGLANLENLIYLNFYNTGLTEIDVLKNLGELYYLNLARTPMHETGFRKIEDGINETIDNMQIIKNLNSKKLTHIYLSNTNISDFSKISSLTWKEHAGF